LDHLTVVGARLVEFLEANWLKLLIFSLIGVAVIGQLCRTGTLSKKESRPTPENVERPRRML
jgi:hypothetical protein